MKDVIEDEVLFERIDEDPMIVAIALATLNQANILNVFLLNERIAKAWLEKRKLRDEITSLKIEM